MFKLRAKCFNQVLVVLFSSSEQQKTFLVILVAHNSNFGDTYLLIDYVKTTTTIWKVRNKYQSRMKFYTCW